MPRHAIRWLAALLLSVPILSMLVIALFGWNWIRGPLQHLVFEKTGRALLIDGELDIHLDWRKPRIVARSVSFANPAWARQPQMLVADRIEVSVDLVKLFHQKLEFPEVHLIRPVVSLEKTQDGRKTWLLDVNQQDENARIPIGLLTLDLGHLNYTDEGPKTTVEVDLSTQPASPASGIQTGNIVFSAKGTYRNLAFSAQGSGGPALALHDETSPYPLDMVAQVGTTHASAKGTVTGLLKFSAADLLFSLNGKSLADLYPLAGLVLPVTHPYALSGHLVHKPKRWRYENFNGHIGHSDITGSLQLDMAGIRPTMLGQIASQSLDLDDLGPMIGAKAAPTGQSGTKTTPPSTDRLLPARPFDTARWFSMDATVSVRAQRLTHAMGIPLDNLMATLNLKGGVLSLDPLDFSLAGGHLKGAMTMDARTNPMQTHAKVTVEKILLAQLFPNINLANATLGQINGHLDLAGRGNSVARMLATADGRVALLVGKGLISRLMMEEVSLHLLEILHLKMAGDKHIVLNCALADFTVKQGQMQATTLVLDTEINTITGSGRIDMADEAPDLKLLPQTRSTSPVALSSPIYIKGHFAHPLLTLDARYIAARGVGAIALSVVNPLLALLALVDIGPGLQSQCPALVGSPRPVGAQANRLAPRQAPQ